tara:strand:- start:10590 stop:11801 length:1212 start_codon:yes stop_codon:yes gene_type:complete
MALIKPFQAWRPAASKVQDIVCVPYDVITTKDALELSKGKPLSFLHVIRPEIDLPADISIYHTSVYSKGRESLQKLLNAGHFIQEEQDSLYIYRLVWNGRAQSGVFGCVSVKEYENDIILKHELTRPDKEDDRTKHITTQEAHAEPVMLTFDDTKDITGLMVQAQENDPIYDITTEDGVQHSIWKIDDASTFQQAFDSIPSLYIADGHHRCASAARTAREIASQNPTHTGEENYNYFPAVLFPMQQMEILSYNRVIFQLPDNFFERLSSSFMVTPSTESVPQKKGSICIYYDGRWYALDLPASQKSDSASALDVSRLQEFILAPLLGITNQRTDKNIDFVGGIKSTLELEHLVDSESAQLAFSMYPTNIKELITVSDDGLLMPPKSTWFEPKLRSGFLIHTFK